MRQCVGCGMGCGTLRDVERGKVWAVAWNVERCAMWNEAVWAVAWNVECYVMWNEAECGLWHGMWNVVRCGMRQNVGCDTARYVVVEVALCEM